ncbi:MAG: hypothetical protein JWN13_2253 [Betaproteobacteria bacterium]|nr:hypothetical protein [Betaproteobacteria bacterium]
MRRFDVCLTRFIGFLAALDNRQRTTMSQSPIALGKIQVVREYLAEEFPDCELGDRFDGLYETQTFRAQGKEFYLLRVSRELMDDSSQETLAAMLRNRDVAARMRLYRRALLTSKVLEALPGD